MRIEAHYGQSLWRALQLRFDLFNMIGVDVGVSKGMDKVAGLQSAHLSEHQGEQGVGGYIKRYAQKEVGAALVELAREFVVGYIKLKEGVAGGERHVVDFSYVPCADDVAARVGLGFKTLDQSAYLVNLFSVCSWP